MNTETANPSKELESSGLMEVWAAMEPFSIEAAGLSAMLLTPIVAMLIMSGKQKPEGKAKGSPLMALLLILPVVIPFSAIYAALHVESKLKDMKAFTENHSGVAGRKFEFGLNHALEGMTHSESVSGTEKVMKAIPVMHKVWGWSEERAYLQQSLIQSIRACYPKHKFGDRKELFVVPLDRRLIASEMRKVLADQENEQTRTFCQFKTLLKLV